MTRDKVISVLVCVILIGSLVVLWPKKEGLPPIITVLSCKSDMNAIGMICLTLCVSNQNALPSKELVITSAEGSTEVRIGNDWYRLRDRIDCVLTPGDRTQPKFLVVEQATTLRLRFTYRIGRTTQPTQWFRFRTWVMSHTISFMPYKLLHWIAGFGATTSNSRELTLEIAIPPLPKQKANPQRLVMQ